MGLAQTALATYMNSSYQELDKGEGPWRLWHALTEPERQIIRDKYARHVEWAQHVMWHFAFGMYPAWKPIPEVVDLGEDEP